ncbi:hypothetical protein COLO4_11811 [Corchorus olitorius]|uniref:Uncharacterized protein n=1 Tax=Corchorus olitorius TaxID=93759 RepID=A0A1R3K361_9ROSI|nr:hypothetical protein COLO4_11811 [Corchorus olitorius]
MERSRLRQGLPTIGLRGVGGGLTRTQPTKSQTNFTEENPKPNSPKP